MHFADRIDTTRQALVEYLYGFVSRYPTRPTPWRKPLDFSTWCLNLSMGHEQWFRELVEVDQ